MKYDGHLSGNMGYLSLWSPPSLWFHVIFGGITQVFGLVSFPVGTPVLSQVMSKGVPDQLALVYPPG